MEFLYALCLNESQLASAQAGWRTKTMTMPPAGTDYVELYRSHTPEWEEGYDHTLATASKGGQALLVRYDRHGQLQLRVFSEGRLARDLFVSETWVRVEGEPVAWEVKVFGSAIGSVGDETPFAGDGRVFMRL